MNLCLNFNRISSSVQLPAKVSQLYVLTGSSKYQKAQQLLNFEDMNAHIFEQYIYKFILDKNEKLYKSAMYMLAMTIKLKRSSFNYSINDNVINKLATLAKDHALEFQLMPYLFQIPKLESKLIQDAKKQLKGETKNENKALSLFIDLSKQNIKLLTYNSIVQTNSSKKIQNEDLLKRSDKILQLCSSGIQNKKQINVYLQLLIQQAKLIKEVFINEKSCIKEKSSEVLIHEKVSQKFQDLIQRFLKTLKDIVQRQRCNNNKYRFQSNYLDFYIQFQLSICQILMELLEGNFKKLFIQQLTYIVQSFSDKIYTFKFSSMVKKLILCSTQSSFIQINKFKLNSVQYKPFYRHVFYNILQFVCSQQRGHIVGQIKGDAIQSLFCILQKCQDSYLINNLTNFEKEVQNYQQRIKIIKLLKMNYDYKRKISTKIEENIEQNLKQEIKYEIKKILQLQCQYENSAKFIKLNFLLVGLRKRLSLSLQTKNYFLKDQNFKECIRLCLRLFLKQRCIAQSSQLLMQLFKKKFIDKNSLILNVSDGTVNMQTHNYLLEILQFFNNNFEAVRKLKVSMFKLIVQFFINLSKERFPIFTVKILEKLTFMLQHLDGTPNLKVASSFLDYYLKFPLDKGQQLGNLMYEAKKILTLSKKQGQHFLLNTFLIFAQKFNSRQFADFLSSNQQQILQTNAKNQQNEMNNNIRRLKALTVLQKQITSQSTKQIFQILLYSSSPLSCQTIIKFLNYLRICLNYISETQDNPQIREHVSSDIMNYSVKSLIKFFFQVYQASIFGNNLFDKINCLEITCSLLVIALDSRNISVNKEEEGFNQLYKKFRKIYVQISAYVVKGKDGSQQDIQRMAKFQQTNYNLRKSIILILGLLVKYIVLTNQEYLDFQMYLKQQQSMKKEVDGKTKKPFSMQLKLQTANLMFYNEEQEYFWSLYTRSLMNASAS